MILLNILHVLILCNRFSSCVPLSRTFPYIPDGSLYVAYFPAFPCFIRFTLFQHVLSFFPCTLYSYVHLSCSPTIRNYASHLPCSPMFPHEAHHPPTFYHAPESVTVHSIIGRPDKRLILSASSK